MIIEGVDDDVDDDDDDDDDDDEEEEDGCNGGGDDDDNDDDDDDDDDDEEEEDGCGGGNDDNDDDADFLSFLSGESVDMIRLFSLFALEVIMKASFGLDTDLQRNPDELFIQRAKNVFRTPLWIRAFSMFPFWTYLSRFVNILPNAGYFIGLAENIVQQRQQMDSDNHKDLMQLMLDAHKVSIICVYEKLLKPGSLYNAIRAI